MKNKSIILMLAAMGIVGCKNNNAIDTQPEKTKTETIDTALVLGRWHSSYTASDEARFLLVTQNGEKIKLNSNKDIYAFSNVGDTLVIKTTESGNIYIIKNLTMENKANMFAKQK